MQKILIKTFLSFIDFKLILASGASVFIATSMAAGDGVHHLPSAFFCFLATISFQACILLSEKYQEQRDEKTKRTILKFAIACFCITMFSGIFIIARGGIGVKIIILLSMIAALIYTLNCKKTNCAVKREVFIFIFYGPLPVMLTYFVQSFEMNFAIFLSSFSPGLIILAFFINNDILLNEYKLSKNSIVHNFGKAIGQYLYAYCIILGSLVPIAIYMIINDHIAILSCSVISLLAIPNIKKIFTKVEKTKLKQTPTFSMVLLIIYSILFSISWII